MQALHLAGLIINSAQPETLVRFYRDALGIPFALQSHGPLKEHFECDFGGVHFALLKRKHAGAGNLIPSLACANLEAALADLVPHRIKPLHPIIELGEGKRVTSIVDPEGNLLRLFQQT